MSFILRKQSTLYILSLVALEPDITDTV